MEGREREEKGDKKCGNNWAEGKSEKGKLRTRQKDRLDKAKVEKVEREEKTR